MGDPKFIEKIAQIYQLNIGEIDKKIQTEILLAVKRNLTKKEYKATFQYMDLEKEAVLEKLACDSDQLELLIKKAHRKLKHSKLKKEIVAYLEAEKES